MSPCTRRELLALGATATLVLDSGGCERKARDIPGTIRGASMPVGHRLRDATIERASGPAIRVKVAIVGGGPSGLSAAWRLERLGEKDFVVFDLEPQPGGTSAFGTDGVVPYPWGAHYVPLPTKENRTLTSLLGEMGALSRESPEPEGREELLIRAPEERLFVNGSWQEGLFPRALASDRDREELARFQREIDRWVGWRDAKGRRAFALPLHRSSDDAEVTALDRTSAADWFDAQGFSSKPLRWYLEYACRDDYGLALDQTSAWALLFYFSARVPAPGHESAEFLAWPEGNGHLVRHLMKVAGARVKLGSLVTDVVPGEKFVELSVLETASGKLTRYQADRVILATPKFVVPRILDPIATRPPPISRSSGTARGGWPTSTFASDPRAPASAPPGTT